MGLLPVMQKKNCRGGSVDQELFKAIGKHRVEEAVPGLEAILASEYYPCKPWAAWALKEITGEWRGQIRNPNTGFPEPWPPVPYAVE